ncbi:2'-5' RNA ligase family protein [Legionella fallonii]|uniref:Uncharacterized protein n=1 Tax=Legionella fallonii LLAP-10 TaxID=1212491 RepID=A0A098G8M9_9GAMM|nr:2'-5' RNA ligase family protein [Legionella fallonii]CEG58849.1 conserved protein of unknown function [Legionella fallonii LLAP-10]
MSITARAISLPINVYLKLTPNNQVIPLIEHFNQFLQQKKLLSTYHVKPFILTHPLHITLYLATYEETQISAVIKQTQDLAQKQKNISIATERFHASTSGYVMLALEQNERLQQLSNKTLSQLAELRDQHASTPDWASKDRKRQELFKQWGSPSVMSYYQPHFSVFDPEHLSPKQRATLYQKLQLLIGQFSKVHDVKVKATAYAIGVGIADAQGQIIKELDSFPLS